MILNASDNSSKEHISRNAKIMLISAVTEPAFCVADN